MNFQSAEAVCRFSTLFDLVECRALSVSTGVWWGPVIGSDEIQQDGATDNFHESLVQDEGTQTDSDSRLKTDVTEVGTTVYGLPLYQFCYIGSEIRHEGVMAQDVLQVMPSAVSRGSDGYYRVDYGKLGLEMRQVA